MSKMSDMSKIYVSKNRARDNERQSGEQQTIQFGPMAELYPHLCNKCGLPCEYFLCHMCTAYNPKYTPEYKLDSKPHAFTAFAVYPINPSIPWDKLDEVLPEVLPEVLEVPEVLKPFEPFDPLD